MSSMPSSMPEQLGSEEVKILQDAYQKINAVFDQLEDELDPDAIPDLPSPRIKKFKVFPDGSILRINRGKKESELPRSTAVTLEERSPNEFNVSLHSGRYDTQGIINFSISPTGLTRLNLSSIDIFLGDIFFGNVAQTEPKMVRSEDGKNFKPVRDPSDYRSITPTLADWVKNMHDQNQRIPLSFTAES